MSDGFDDGEIPDDLEEEIRDQVQDEVDDRLGEDYPETQQGGLGCLLVIALPALAMWLW